MENADRDQGERNMENADRDQGEINMENADRDQVRETCRMLVETR